MASEIFRHIRKKDTAALKDMLGFGTCCKDVKYQGSFSEYRAALQALKSPTSINAKEGRFGLTTLMVAAKCNNFEAIEILLSYGLSPNTKDAIGMTALQHAITENSLRSVELLMEAKDIDLNVRNSDGDTALILACEKGACFKDKMSEEERTKLVSQLIRKGANLNVRGCFGKTALIHAIEIENWDIVDLLITNKAKTDFPRRRTTDLLALASLYQRGYAESVDTSLPPLHLACAKGKLDIIKAILANGGDVDVIHFLDRGISNDSRKQRPPEERTVLTKERNPEIVELLLIYGADPNKQVQKDYEKWPPLVFAARDGDVMITKLLLSAGANVDDSAAGLALIEASSHGHIGVVSLLLESGVNVTFQHIQRIDAMTRSHNYTALSAALLSNHVDIAELLIANGADISDIKKRLGANVVDNDSEPYLGQLENFLSTTWHATPMHKACYDNDLPSLALLLADCSCVDVRDCDNWTPLHVAVSLGRVEATQVLLENGADIYAVTSRGHSTLHLACSPLGGGQRGQEAMTGRLLKFMKSK